MQIRPEIKEKIVLALDVDTPEQAKELITELKDYVGVFKVGLQMYTGNGYEIFNFMKEQNIKFFFDVKLHDIPNTVKGGMRSLSGLGADLVNVHAAGTIDMMKAALEGVVREDGTRPLVIAVTQLTSTSEERMQKELLINAGINDTIIHYAKNTKEAGLDGIVCSPLEAGMVKEACGKDFLTVTPGVRFADGDVGDQVRVTTPAKAKEIGTDYIVVGRPITKAEDPVAAYRRCMADFAE